MQLFSLLGNLNYVQSRIESSTNFQETLTHADVAFVYSWVSRDVAVSRRDADHAGIDGGAAVEREGQCSKSALQCRSRVIRDRAIQRQSRPMSAVTPIADKRGHNWNVR
jgi:hypothetical protein